MVIDLDRRGDVFVLHMNAGENRLNRPFLDAFVAALDEVERAPGPAALVTTGEGKFYSNGLDLEWLFSGAGEDMRAFVAEAEAVMARLLAFPMITVAAINGHCFAAGAMLALCHDYRVMREDRGYFCLPEVDIKIPFTPGMNALITARLPNPTAHEVMVTGKRYGGALAARRAIVDRAVGEHAVVPEAVDLAADLADKDRATMGEIKRRLYAGPIALLQASEGTAPTG